MKNYTYIFFLHNSVFICFLHYHLIKEKLSWKGCKIRISSSAKPTFHWNDKTNVNYLDRFMCSFESEVIKTWRGGSVDFSHMLMPCYEGYVNYLWLSIKTAVIDINCRSVLPWCGAIPKDSVPWKCIMLSFL